LIYRLLFRIEVIVSLFLLSTRARACAMIHWSQKPDSESVLAVEKLRNSQNLRRED
jgi:hypothetical protein